MSQKVKSVTLYKKDLLDEETMGDDIQSGRRKYNHTQYDTQGNLLQEVKYAYDGTIEEKVVYSFDDMGKLIEEAYFAEGEELLQKKSYERDEKGEIILEFMHYADGSKDTIHYHYNDKGLLIEKVTIDDEDTTELKEVFEYEGDNLIAEKSYDESMDLISEKTYQYDEQKNLIESTVWDIEEDIQIREVNEYREDHILSRTIRYEDEKLVARSTYKTDDKNRVIEVVEESPLGEMTFRTIYDENGNPYIQDIKDSSGNVVNSVKRVYDDDKRVLESRVFIDGQKRSISQEYIIYYEYEFHPESG